MKRVWLKSEGANFSTTAVASSRVKNQNKIIFIKGININDRQGIIMEIYDTECGLNAHSAPPVSEQEPLSVTDLMNYRN